MVLAFMKRCPLIILLLLLLLLLLLSTIKGHFCQVSLYYIHKLHTSGLVNVCVCVCVCATLNTAVHILSPPAHHIIA